MQQLADKNVAGTLTDQQYVDQQQRLQTALDALNAGSADVFGVAPRATRRAAGHVGLPLAGAFVAAHLLLFLATETAGLRVAHTAFPLLVLASYAATGLAVFVVPAFAFGACYELVRGRSGLQKALTVAGWVIVCSLPSWLLRLPSVASVLSIAVETALFYAVLGLTFDIAIAREGAGSQFRLRDIPRLSGIPALSWAGSIVVASLGVAVSGALSGQFQNVVTSTITSVYRQATLGQ
jgi:hypothetical protein